jgi:S-DNA-T family DNA segregation ATPase FtsK/SpoIIIE
MAKTKRSKNNTRNRLSLSDNQKWIVGLVIFFFAIYALWVCVSYLFTWNGDQAVAGALGGGSEPGSDKFVSAAEAIPTGEKGSLGVHIARLLVGRGFGLFAIAIPLVLSIIGLRLMRYRPTALERSIRVTLAGMILGSMTLGLVFGTQWGVFGSGLGGETGIFAAGWLRETIGLVGAALALICLWILLAVYVSRKNISRVNRVGRAIADSGARVGGLVTKRREAGWGVEPGETRGARGAGGAGARSTDEDEDGGVETIYETPDNQYDDEPAPVKKRRSPWERLGLSGRKHRTWRENGYEEDEENPASSTPAGAEGTPHYHGGEFLAGVSPAPGGESPATRLEATEGSPFVVRDITGGHVVEVTQPQESVIPTVMSTPDGIFEVVELRNEAAGGGYGNNYKGGGDNFSGAANSSGGGTTLGAGGVVASNGEWMEVLQTENRDTELADDDIENRLYDPLKELSSYRKPEIESILANHGTRVEVTDEEIQANSNRIVQTLRNFGIEISKIKATIGPTVTLYEIIPAPGVKISKIKGLEQDIALSLKALGIRIIAPMPGKGTIGIEVPNQNREVVSMYSLVKSIKFQDSTAELPLVLGKTIQNETFLVDLAKMPHLLIAGATGQGKSVGLNVIISSLLYKKHPAEVKFVMVDPKKVELSLYSRLEKHFLAKMESEEDAILTDTQKVVYTLNSLCGEMEARYELLRKAEVKKISEYNEKFINRRLNPNKGHRYLPYIVVVIDEFADMIMTAGKEVEQPITRLAQLARATGIHLIIATQRPDVKVITGLIKANFPARIAFRVTSIVDSRTILDQTGANQLIGQGDMLISMGGELTRLQCAFIDTPEIERMTQFIHDQRGYPSAYALPDWMPEGSGDGPTGGEMGDVDRMFEEVARFVVSNQQGSTSNIQRHFAIGYNRAGRLMDQLERAGIVGRAEGSKPREVLIQDPRSLDRIFEDLGIL